MKAIVVAQGADLLTCLAMVLLLGIGAEGNGLVRDIWPVAGVVGLVAFKAGWVGLVALTRNIVGRRGFRTLRFVSITLGILGAGSNVAYLAGAR